MQILELEDGHVAALEAVRRALVFANPEHAAVVADMNYKALVAYCIGQAIEHIGIDPESLDDLADDGRPLN